MLLIKQERRFVKDSPIEKEMELLLKTKTNNPIINIIPELIKFGYESEYNFLITSSPKMSLEQLFLSHKSSFSLGKACKIILESLNSLEILHNNNIIHRDINPKVLSIDSKGKINFLHLGFWKFYKNKSGHIECKSYKKMIGKNIIFGSINNLIGFELSRRDDLQSLAYMLIYFVKGFLPWDNLNIKKSEEKIKIILDMKKNISDDLLTEGLPKEIKLFISYTKKLKFDEEPNYNYLKNILKNLMNSKDSYKNFYF